MLERKLIVRTDKQIAEIWQDGVVLKSYRISTATNGLGCIEGSNCTPHGRFKVSEKIGEGFSSGSVFRSRVATGEVWSANVGNPLASSAEDLVLTRILWLEGAEVGNANTLERYIYLHGTNQESLLGTPVSHGCIRFSNSDIIEVFQLLEQGAEVEVC